MTKSPDGLGKIERRDGGRQVCPADRRAVSARLGFDFRGPLGKGGAVGSSTDWGSRRKRSYKSNTYPALTPETGPTDS